MDTEPEAVEKNRRVPSWSWAPQDLGKEMLAAAPGQVPAPRSSGPWELRPGSVYPGFLPADSRPCLLPQPKNYQKGSHCQRTPVLASDKLYKRLMWGDPGGWNAGRANTEYVTKWQCLNLRRTRPFLSSVWQHGTGPALMDWGCPDAASASSSIEQAAPRCHDTGQGVATRRPAHTPSGKGSN